MPYCIKRRILKRTHKEKEYSYIYFELWDTYRDPLDKSQVKSSFVKHLGKSREEAVHNLKEMMQSQGKISLLSLIKEINRKLE